MLHLIIVFLSFMSRSFCNRVVMTNTGPVQGITVESEGSRLEAYLGIPYAEPPIERLRFAKPVPKTPWLGVYDASSLPPPCIQNQTRLFYYAPDITNMTEDCLYLNIWVPHSKQRSALKPILFFIHGGAFNIGSSNQKVYDGAKFAARGDIIVVTINYRVGVLGFFSAFIPDADGNMGIYDQVLALNWIKDNSLSFGGDPNHIILFGESAGAICAAGHTVSPLTKHAVKRVILQSGAAMMPFALDENARLYKVSQSLAATVGCSDTSLTIKDNPRIIVNCLKRLPAEELARAEGILMMNNPITFIPRTGDSYLPNNSIEMIRNGDFVNVDMLIGVTKDEGTFFLTTTLPNYFGVYGINPVRSISKRLSYQLMRIMYKILGESHENKIPEFYINSIVNGTSDKYTKAISESIGDYFISCNCVFHSEFHSVRGNPVYFYVYKHRSSASPLADWMGVTHYDELEFVFGNPLHSNFTKEEEIMSRRIMKRWIAFIRTGNPNIEGEIDWPLYSYKSPNYLEIDIEECVRFRPDNYRCEFWRNRYHAELKENVIQKIRSSTGRRTAKYVYVLAAILMALIY